MRIVLLAIAMLGLGGCYVHEDHYHHGHHYGYYHPYHRF